MVVLAGGSVGLRVIRHLRESGDRILRVYAAGGEEYAREAEQEAGAGPARGPGDVSAEDLEGLEIDFMLTVYWPRLLPPKVFGLARGGCVNFHPALLPANRGWYPHVHSILDGSPAGVTLHLVDEGADTGPVLAQKEVGVLPSDNAGTLYARLQDEITGLFMEIWPAIKDGSIRPAPQDGGRATYHEKSEVDALDRVDPEKKYRAKDLIDLLRARSFGPRGFAYFEDGGRVYMRLELNRTGVFR